VPPAAAKLALEALLRSGDRARTERRIKDAQKDYLAALAIEPTNPTVKGRLGVIAARAGDHIHAVAYLDDAVRQNGGRTPEEQEEFALALARVRNEVTLLRVNINVGGAAVSIATVVDPDCLPDAGPDGSAEGPGIGPQACSSRCVPFPDDTAAGFWSQDPLLVWAGPPDEFPKDSCPPDMALQFSRYAELVAPPLVCPTCGCEKSMGTCSGVPDQIQIRAGTCDDPAASSLPFDGPPSWDGSCTDMGALPQGAKCPAGSSTLCAQAIAATTLPPPTDEKCEVTSDPVPTFGGSVSWAKRVLACRGTVLEGACGDAGKDLCVMDLPLPWQQCIWRVGAHEECPAPYTAGRYLYGNRIHGRARVLGMRVRGARRRRLRRDVAPVR
jgi:hypothetical protein